MKTSITNPRINYMVREVCALGNFSKSYLYLLWQEGKGPRRFKLGRKTLVRAEDFHAWLDSLAGE